MKLRICPKSITDVKVLVLGVAFKRDVDDTRHSPALKVIELLVKDGLEHISYNDPFVPNLMIGGKDLHSVELSEKELRSSDIVVITTDHTEYDYEFIVKNATLIIDTRNATKKITDETLRKKIVLLGAGENK